MEANKVVDIMVLVKEVGPVEQIKTKSGEMKGKRVIQVYD